MPPVAADYRSRDAEHAVLYRVIAAPYYNLCARFRIAAWQARQGGDPATIQQLVDPIVTTPVERRTTLVFRLLTTLASAETSLGYRHDALRLAMIDPRFRAVLVSLGWSDIAP